MNIKILIFSSSIICSTESCLFSRECKSLVTTGFSLRKQEKYLPFQCYYLRKKMCKREMQAEAAVSTQSDGISSSGYSGSGGQFYSGSASEREGSSASGDFEKWYTVLHCTPLVSPYTGKLVCHALCETCVLLYGIIIIIIIIIIMPVIIIT